MTSYFDAIHQVLKEAEAKNAEALDQCAEAVVTSLTQGGVLHTFGTGHGHMLAEELFYRAGGLVPINAILDPSLMLHLSALGSTQLERLSGYAEIVLERYVVKSGDVMVIASNSGRNSVTIEMALAAKSRGLKVIALTSIAHSQSQSSRHSSGKRLFEIADIVLDNCGVIGDAAVEVEGLAGRIGATSTVVGTALLHTMVHKVVLKMLEQGVEVPVTLSSNVDGGDEHNSRLFDQYRDRLRHL